MRAVTSALIANHPAYVNCKSGGSSNARCRCANIKRPAQFRRLPMALPRVCMHSPTRMEPEAISVLADTLMTLSASVQKGWLTRINASTGASRHAFQSKRRRRMAVAYPIAHAGAALICIFAQYMSACYRRKRPIVWQRGGSSTPHPESKRGLLGICMALTHKWRAT